jgi:integrase
MTIMFTPAKVEALTLGPFENESIVFETDTGLALRLRKRQGDKPPSKTFLACYVLNGKPLKKTLGKFPQRGPDWARVECYKIRENAGNGIGPDAAEKEAAAEAARASSRKTLAEYVPIYLKLRTQSLGNRNRLAPKTYAEQARYLTGPYWEPLKELYLDAINKAMVAEQLNRIKTQSKSVAQSARSALFVLYTLAIEDGLAKDNPVKGTRYPINRRVDCRKRYLDPVELAALWRATSGDDQYSKLVRLLILTGCRRSEVGGMCWTEVDQATGIWTIPAARSKTRKPRALPLPAVALAILRSIERRDERDQVFGVRGPNGFELWDPNKKKLDEVLQLEQPWVLHDLRRTFITLLDEELETYGRGVRAITGHAEDKDDSGGRRDVDDDTHNVVYNQSKYVQRKARILNKWCDYVQGLAGENVFSLKQAA